IHHAKNYQIEYLKQESDLDHNATVIEQIYFGDSEIMEIMRGYEQALLNMQQNEMSEKAQTDLMNMQQKMDQYEAWNASTVAKTILSKLGITDIERQVAELSGGEKKRVA